MRLECASLQNFRSYERRSFELGVVTMVTGGNGVGKSNLLEAVYLLATGKSFRAEAEYEMIHYGQGFARVQATMTNDQDPNKFQDPSPNDQTSLEILLTDGSMEGAKKKYFVNGVSKRMVDFVGRWRAVLFGPGDMELVTGSPSGRRRYLDFVIAQADREYRRCLLSYEKGLRQRNKLLDMIREGRGTRNQLFFWDRLLIKNGEYVTQKRQEYLDGLEGESYVVEYDKSVVSESRLKQYEKEEVAAGSTLVGPHRDDFVVKLEERDVAKYGSRGEQRMAVLWLKLGERDYLRREGELPALLLDDIFSELDHSHREEVVKMVEEQVKNGGQVVMTTADPHLVPQVKGARMIEL